MQKKTPKSNPKPWAMWSGRQAKAQGVKLQTWTSKGQSRESTWFQALMQGASLCCDHPWHV